MGFQTDIIMFESQKYQKDQKNHLVVNNKGFSIRKINSEKLKILLFKEIYKNSVLSMLKESSSSLCSFACKKSRICENIFNVFNIIKAIEYMTTL